MFHTDVTVKVTYDLNDLARCKIETDAKREALEEILSAWVQSQLGQGKDERVPADREVYTIIISLDLNGDVFSTTADTANDSLTLGIIASAILPNLDDIKVCALVA